MTPSAAATVATTEPIQGDGSVRVRGVCCNKSWHLYCPVCCKPLAGVAPPPPVALPVHLHMYRHPSERIGKSTSTHAKVAAFADTTLFVEDCKALGANAEIRRERYPDPSRVLVLFPSEDAKPLTTLPCNSFDTVIVLDGTWKQAKTMYTAIKHIGFQPVTIGFPDQVVKPAAPPPSTTLPISANPEATTAKRSTIATDPLALIEDSSLSTSNADTRPPVTTLFWRFQNLGEHCLSTIEAVYYFFRDHYATYMPGVEYDGRYEGLLYYFRMQYETVQGYYREHPEKSFTQKKANAESYIKYD
ncbi:hypothetical protein BC830DRAFT_698005 [Chytriomyces sp. MP71]|nr:hypothetical protein BC830DRAFT_698005 [Chytriomyces sp. MP71]